MEVAAYSSSVVRRLSLFAAFLLSLGTRLSAEPPPTRQSDFAIPTVNPSDFVTTSDGNKFVLGFDTIQRFSPTGFHLWTRPIPQVPEGGGFSFFQRIAVLPDNTSFATQRAILPFFGLYERAFISRIDANGTASIPRLITSDPLPTEPGTHLFEMRSGVATDLSRDRVYAAAERFGFPLNFEVQVRAFDGSLNPVAAATFLPEEVIGAPVNLSGVFVDSGGFVSIAGLEIQSLGHALFFSRFGPNLAGPQITHRFPIPAAQVGEVRAAGDYRGGVVFSVTPFSGTEQSFTIRADGAGFKAIRPYPAFVITSLATDTDGTIYAGGISRTTSRHGVIKVDVADASVWTPEMLSLESGRSLSIPWSPSVGTLDLASQAGGATFLSRYAPGGSNFRGIVALTPSDQFAPTGTPMLTPLEFGVQDNSTIPPLPQGNVEVNYSITQHAPPSGRSSAVFHSSETTTNSITGLARVGLTVGYLPLEYSVSANCPSCQVPFDTAAIQVCGKISTRMFRNNVDSNLAGEEPWTTQQLDNHRTYNVPGDLSRFGTIQFKGCALTAMTMLLNIFRERYGLTYSASTPFTLNEFWKINDTEHYGFAEAIDDPLRNLIRQSDGGINFRRATARFTKRAVRFIDEYRVETSNIDTVMAKVDESLDRGDPAILQIESSTDAGHYMPIVGRCGRKYSVLDSNINTNHTVVDLDNPTVTILGARIFERGI